MLSLITQGIVGHYLQNVLYQMSNSNYNGIINSSLQILSQSLKQIAQLY